MRHLITTLCLFPLLLGLASAQHTGLYITFSGGPAFPTGAYGDQSGDGSGYAQLGINGTAGVGFRLSRYLALGAKFAFTQNPTMDDGPLVEDSPWKNNFFLADLTGNLPLGSRFDLEANLMAGYNQAQFPDGSFQLGSLTINNEGGSAGAFAMGGGLGLRYWLDDYVSFKLGATYLGSNPSLEQGENSIPQNVRLLTTNFGITLTMD